MSTKAIVTDPAAYHAAGVISNGPLLHISGQPGTLAGKTPSDGVSQIHLALLNLHRVIAAAGASPRDIVSLTLYVVNYDAANRLHPKPLQTFLAGHLPAVTVVPVPALAVPEWKYEIAATVAVPSPTVPRSLPSPTDADVDVLVIGAGLSGLAAAESVLQSGLSCLVLEGRDRVGGKTWTETLPSGTGVVDLGAAWINDTNQTEMIALARRAGVELIEQNTTGNCLLEQDKGPTVLFPYGQTPCITPQIQSELDNVREMCEADCQALSCESPTDPALDSLSFYAYLQSRNVSPAALATASVWTRAMLGQEPTDISALYFLNYCRSGGGLIQMRSDRRHGAQYLRVREGTQSFAQTMAGDLPTNTILFGERVDAILPSPRPGVVVLSRTGRAIRAKKVICSTPTPVLKTIQFHPPLPAKKQLLVDSFRYGYYTKVMLVFRSAWWVERGYCGLVQSFKGPASIYRDTGSPRDGKFVLTAFLAGESGRQWAREKDPRKREQALLRQLGRIYDEPEVPATEFVEALGHEWSEEELSGWGCPCPALPPGVLTLAGEALREPVGNVHFVGTETAAEWKGYMEGAVRSGRRGAREVVQGLNRSRL
ncbi:putative flavin-containing amine oxidase [Aspergillus brunneoviolaceus CBS 621.78]|uniref:FAD/NAD(P)-binding domain-containing protein n=1 Tax=Aspergillus brunneoviolaceus CBS 621.78 TaxID=1450534 RepID=A0ACD1GFE6_9EURO|nr:FAD/NAD(P)-binding domain-containing protein [Aspergillus brunneoviolaceus CBS 621.78]RAH47902.1 FAD/NAD(P)-binding domain-containing protein [Aspergillus brunneoviolaceus CBS 621.78]